MKDVLKKLSGVYQKGIECVRDYEGIEYLETCQIFYLEGLFLIISLVINKCQVYKKGDRFVHWLVSFKYDLRFLFIIGILLHVVSIYVICYLKKHEENEAIKDIYVRVGDSVNFWILIIEFIVSMSVFPVFCLTILFFSILMPIFVMFGFLIVSECVEHILNEISKDPYREKRLEKQMKVNIFLLCEYAAMIGIFLVAVSLFNVGIIFNIASIIVFAFVIPFISGMSKEGYNLFEALLKQPSDEETK